MQAGEKEVPWDSLSSLSRELSYAQLNTLFVATLLESGIPAREVLGILYDEREGTYGLWQWGELYLEGVGWVPADIGLSQMRRESFWLRQSENHIVLAPLPKEFRALTVEGEMFTLEDAQGEEIQLLSSLWLYESVKGKGRLRLTSLVFESMERISRRRV